MEIPTRNIQMSRRHYGLVVKIYVLGYKGWGFESTHLHFHSIPIYFSHVMVLKTALVFCYFISMRIQEISYRNLVPAAVFNCLLYSTYLIGSFVDPPPFSSCEERPGNIIGILLYLAVPKVNQNVPYSTRCQGVSLFFNFNFMLILFNYGTCRQCWGSGPGRIRLFKRP